MGLNKRSFAVGVLFSLLLVGCASFGYRYYTLSDITVWNGKMLGDKPEHDLPFSVCEPKPENKNPCVVMLSDEFFRFKQEYERMSLELNDCQANQ